MLSVALFISMLNVILLNVLMLNVMAPQRPHIVECPFYAFEQKEYL
jgi:hypothetical protein